MRYVLLTVFMLALAGCADEGGQDAGPAGTQTTSPSGNQTTDAPPAPVALTVRTTGTTPVDPGFDTDRIEVPAGATVELTLMNEDGNPTAPHDLVVDGIEGAATETIRPGEQTTVTFTAPAEPGEFPFFCSIGDHRDLGMEGVFVVA